MPRIGFVQRDGEAFVGLLRTMSIKMPIRIEPAAVTVARSPDWRVIADEDIDIGAGWSMKHSETGEDYINLQLVAPEFGRIYVNLNPNSGGEHGGRIALMWNVTRGK